MNMLFKLLKFLALLMLFCLSVWIITLLSSYLLSRWTPAQSKAEIYGICYVAIADEQAFISIKALSNQAISHADHLSKQQDFNYWQLTTDGEIKQVYYDSDDYFSWFRYRIVNHQIEPISCRVVGPANGALGLAISILLFLMISWTRRFIIGASYDNRK